MKCVRRDRWTGCPLAVPRARKRIFSTAPSKDASGGLMPSADAPCEKSSDQAGAFHCVAPALPELDARQPSDSANRYATYDVVTEGSAAEAATVNPATMIPLQVPERVLTRISFG